MLLEVVLLVKTIYFNFHFHFKGTPEEIDDEPCDSADNMVPVMPVDNPTGSPNDQLMVVNFENPGAGDLYLMPAMSMQGDGHNETGGLSGLTTFLENVVQPCSSCVCERKVVSIDRILIESIISS